MKTDPFDLIVASKGHPFLKHVISGLIPAQMNYGLPYITVMASAGSMYLTEKYGVYENKKDIMIFSKEIYVGKYFKHYKGGSWHSWDGRIIWFLYNKINSLFSNDGKKSLAAFKLGLYLISLIVIVIILRLYVLRRCLPVHLKQL